MPAVTSSNVIKTRIGESRKLFILSVWPLWKDRLASAGIISVEDSEQPLERAADASGTDAFMVRHVTGVLVPLASRIEYFDEQWNNPANPKYAEHYPRFTIRLACRQRDDSLFEDVECRKRLAALDDPVSRRYLPLHTFQTLIRRDDNGDVVMQSSCVDTVALFNYVKIKGLDSLDVGKPSFTNRERDAYRLVTVAKLKKAGVNVVSL